MADMPRKNREFDKLVGRRLTAVRVELGFEYIRAFAVALGVEEDRYSSWEKGKNSFPPEFASLLTEKWGVSMDWLYSRDPNRLKPEYYATRRAAP